MALERTFSILKPDVTRRNLTGAVNARIEAAGLRVIAQKRVHMTRGSGSKPSTGVHGERPFFGELVEMMTAGAGGRAGARRRQRHRQISRGDGRDQPGEGRRRHDPQGFRAVDGRELRPRLRCSGDRRGRKSRNGSPATRSSAELTKLRDFRIAIAARIIAAKPTKHLDFIHLRQYTDPTFWTV